MTRDEMLRHDMQSWDILFQAGAEAHAHTGQPHGSTQLVTVWLWPQVAPGLTTLQSKASLIYLN